MIENAEFLVDTGKRCYKMPVTMDVQDDRILFLKSPFALKDEIKAMQGARWHGFVDGDNRKIWSVRNSQRNLMQIEWLKGNNPYEWFDRPLVKHEYQKFGSEGFGYYDMMSQQKLMTDTGLTYHYQIWAAEMGTGKTLSAIALMVMSQIKDWWWIGPASSFYGIYKEFAKWGLPEGYIKEILSYEGMVQKMLKWRKGDKPPTGIIFDESQRLKTPDSKRTQAAQAIADNIRKEYGTGGYVILMSGTPSPQVGDWWAQCEIAWPGFLKEGSRDTFEKRLGFFRQAENLSGQMYKTRVAWRDDCNRCDECGQYLRDGHHMLGDGEIVQVDTEFDTHVFRESTNEVADLYDRLNGLATIVHKKDCLDLPDKIYRIVECTPDPSLLRVAHAISRTAPSAIQGVTLLRELSDGFQYRDVQDGEVECNCCTDGTMVEHYHPHDPDATIHGIELLDPTFVDELQTRTVKCHSCQGTRLVPNMKRIVREVPCPKDNVVRDLLDENFDQGRLVFFAGFTGSIDRIVALCHKEGWDTIRLDGRGWKIEKIIGCKDNGLPETKQIIVDNPLDYWTSPDNNRVAFVAHPQSGGISMTLCQQGHVPGAVMEVFFSNDFNPASRTQAEDRIYRIGMDYGKGATIVDIIHLPTDRRVREVIKTNRKLELMSMGELLDE